MAFNFSVARAWSLVVVAVITTSLLCGPAIAQEEGEAASSIDTLLVSPDTTGMMPRDKYVNGIAGEFTPAKGFDIIRTSRGSLNVSFYGLFRSLNQFPANQRFTDHLGRVREVDPKSDVNWHRTFVWFSGFFYVPKFTYTISLWSLPTTINTILFGKLAYRISPAATFAVGIGPNLTNRSLQGSFPFWAGSDRQMMEDALRGGFASGFWLSGEPTRKLYYTASVNRSIAQIGVPGPSDNRYFSYSASVWWMPTTGEFGPRAGFGDLENHRKLATRFGISACYDPHEGRYSPVTDAPRATQIKLSDGVNPFETGALADTVTVKELKYENVSVDFGFKYHGFSFQSEYTVRKLSNFDATSPLPLRSITDRGIYVQGMHMVVPKYVGLFASTSYIWDDFKRNPYEISGGSSYYPFGNRNVRLNLFTTHVYKSAASSDFGYYTAGQTGTTFSLGADILL